MAMSRCTQCKKKIQEGEEMKIKLSTIHKECLQEYIGKHIEKVSVDRKKNERNFKKAVQRKKQKSGLETTQIVVNKYIRERDCNNEGGGHCISCGRWVELGSPSAQAGHYHSVGARSDLRFKEDNIHLQCKDCNMYGTADKLAAYKENLLKKIGKKRFDALNIREKQDYSVEGLKKIRVEYKEKITNL